MVYVITVKDMKIINLIGASGCGKTTTALGLTYFLKLKGYKVEYVSEWIKEEIFNGNLNVVNDQMFVFSNQYRKLKSLYNSNLDFIVTDCPLILAYYYGNKYKASDLYLDDLTLNRYLENDHIDYLLNHSGTFETFGRLQGESESLEDEKQLINLLTKLNINFTQILDNKVDSILCDLITKGIII